MANDFPIVMEDMGEIVGEFLVEADELVGSLERNLIDLEASSNDPEILNEIFRAAHTIKGTSSFLGLDQVTELAHRMEDVLNKLRKGELDVTPELADLLLESLDKLKALLDLVRNGTDKKLRLGGLIKRLTAACEDKPSPAKSKKSKPDKTTEEQPDEARSISEEIEQDKADPSEAAPTAPSRPATESTIRVDVSRLDALMNIVGELVLSRNGVIQSFNDIQNESVRQDKRESVEHALSTLNFITTELQAAVMKMRMQPINKVFSKLPRLVRDLARETDKKLTLDISGETTELDKSVIDQIGDPLVHIIRNACDHGIESPAERIKAGKPENGTIHLSAAQEGSNIIIKIVDDGRGLNAGAIKARAIERGLTTAKDAELMTDEEVFHFIFEPGFSTAAVVSGISGRGVGMDVVRTNIEKLNGLVELMSQPSIGTAIIIKLPLTLAIIQGLTVECDGQSYIVPLASIHETVRTDNIKIQYVSRRPVFRLREEVIPIVNPVELLNGHNDGITMTEKPYIVVVGLGDKKLGLIVDHFSGQEEAVIKSLGTYLGNAEGIAGATITGEGRIRLIIDLIGLFKLARKSDEVRSL